MEDDDDVPLGPTLEEVREQIRRGLADAAAGRTRPAADVLAELDSRIGRMEAARTDAG